MEHFLVYLAIGACAGVLSGLLGVGGGVVIVPALAIIFEQLDVPAAIVLHMAIGTSLATIVVTSLSSIYAHHRRGAIQWRIAWQLVPTLAIGSLGGAALAGYIHSDSLRVLLGIFIFAVAVQIGFGYKPAPHRPLPGRAGMALAGGGIGLLSAIFGIGGGIMTVPLLVWRNVPIRLATATSVVCGLIIALAGAAGFMIGGVQAGALNAHLSRWSTGFVYWPAFAGIVVASVPTAPLGAWLAHVLATRWLEIVFAVILGMTALKLLTL